MTSRFVIKYNLTSLRNRLGVQEFFGRPITRLRLEAAFGFDSCPYLRFSVSSDGDVGLADRIESVELNIDDFTVDGLALSWLEGDEIVPKGNAVKDVKVVEELMVMDI